MNPEDTRDLLALGAAGALSDDEYQALERLLAADPALAAEYQELQASASVLAEVTSETPPRSLRASVLDAVKDVEQLPVAQPAPHPAPSSNVVPIHRRSWFLAASVAASIFALLAAVVVFDRIAEAPSDDLMAAVLNDDDAVTFELAGPLTGLHLVSSEDENAAVLMGHNVAMPAAGMVFQLWAIHDEEKVGMATFMPAATGEVAMVIHEDGSDAQWAVTVEPKGGSDQPTSDPVAASPA